MNMFARFDENPAMTLRVIKETKRYGRTDRRTDNVKTVYPLQTKFAGQRENSIPLQTKFAGGIMSFSIFIFIYTIHLAYLKVYTKF